MRLIPLAELLPGMALARAVRRGGAELLPAGMVLDDGRLQQLAASGTDAAWVLDAGEQPGEAPPPHLDRYDAGFPARLQAVFQASLVSRTQQALFLAALQHASDCFRRWRLDRIAPSPPAPPPPAPAYSGPVESGPPPGEDAVLGRLGAVTHLPALPVVAQAVANRLSGTGTTAGEIAALMAHDQALTARVLRLANSAFYAPREPVRTVEQAVMVLGLGTVRAIILKAGVFSTFDPRRARGLWLHALAAACAARAVARRAGLPRSEDAFVMGLLHDLGKVALAEHLPALYAPAAARARAGGLLRDAERALLACDHADVGRYLAERWGLPAEFRAAIAGHHDLDRAAEEVRPWAAAVHLADILARSLLVGDGGDDGMPVIDARCLPLLGLGDRDFPALLDGAEDELQRAEAFAAIITG